MIDAVSAPIDKKFAYKKRQDIKLGETYDEKLFYTNGAPSYCKEFFNQDCQKSGDCFKFDEKSGKEISGSTLVHGVKIAEPGQCDTTSPKQGDKKSWKQKMRDMATSIKEKMGMDSDGKMALMDSSTRLATTAIAAASISMTLY